MKAHGHFVDITFDGETITINRSGWMSKLGGRAGTKTIPLASVTATAWKEPTLLVNGYLSFTIPGGQELKNSGVVANDPNTALFTHGQADEFRAIKEVIDEAIVGRSHAEPTA